MFPKSFSSINSESDGRSPLVPGVVLALLAAWGVWFLLVPVSIYESSERARIEVARSAHPVDSPVLGRVVAIPGLVLGRNVQAGEVLVEVDCEAQRLELAEVQARIAGLGPQLEATKRQAELELAGIEAEMSRGRFATKEAKSRYREARIMAVLAKEEAERSARLLAAGTVPEAEAGRRRANSDRQRAAAAAVAAEFRKLGSAALASESDRRARVAALEREAATLESELALQRARAQSLAFEIERRKIRAPTAGRVGEVATLQVGSMVKPGDRIATIIAGDQLRVVAELPPADAFGRVRVGQAARVEVDAFPWTEYGVVTATVSSVAGELREGLARVELSVVDGRGLPLQHGLPSRVSIEVEVATAAQLVLRAAGRALANRSPPELP